MSDKQDRPARHPLLPRYSIVPGHGNSWLVIDCVEDKAIARGKNQAEAQAEADHLNAAETSPSVAMPETYAEGVALLAQLKTTFLHTRGLLLETLGVDPSRLPAEEPILAVLAPLMFGPRSLMIAFEKMEVLADSGRLARSDLANLLHFIEKDAPLSAACVFRGLPYERPPLAWAAAPWQDRARGTPNS